jgi:hypothetical protein
MRRRPPFALVLVGLIAALGGALAALGGGGGRHSAQTATSPSTGPVRECVTARAEAAAVAARTVRAPVSATLPVTVTESAGGVSVTLSERVAEQAVASRGVEVRRAVISSRRACARGATPDAARSTALTRAYKEAKAAARARATVEASAAAAAFAASELPTVIASAQRLLDARLQNAAAMERQRLAAQARARLP